MDIYGVYRGKEEMWLVAGKSNIYSTCCSGGELKSFTFKNGVTIPQILVRKATPQEFYEDTRVEM